MKSEILKLRSEGKSYNDICRILNCSKSTVAWHCSTNVRIVSMKARNKNRKKAGRDLKEMYGGKCFVCGYGRCFSSLHFHHLDRHTKSENVSFFLHKKGKSAAIKEAKKCVLVCGNCHGEIEEGLISIPG